MVKHVDGAKQEQAKAVASDQLPAVATASAKPRVNAYSKLLGFLKTKKGALMAACGALILLVAVLLAVPTTRYAILGAVVKRNVTVTVTDSATNRPVSEATVVFAGQTGSTDPEGVTHFGNVSVGDYEAQVSKAYFTHASQNVQVQVFAGDVRIAVSLVATGRQVPVSVINKISGKLVSNVLLTVGDSSAKTNDSGEAVLVVAADQKDATVTLKADGYNDTQANIEVTDQVVDANKLSLVPSGKIFYSLGTDIYKANIDGSSKELLVGSSGRDSIETTFLFKVSPDRKWLALLSLRTGDRAKLYLVNTANGNTAAIDDKDNTSYKLFGWSGDRVVYSITREDMNEWEPKRETLKTYQPGSDTYVTIDENTAFGEFNNVAIERFREARFLGDEIVYIKDWILPHGGTGDTVASKRISLMSVQADGSNRKLIVDMNNQYFSKNIVLAQYKPEATYVFLDDGSKYYSYENHALKEDASIVGGFYDVSGIAVAPSGKMSAWNKLGRMYVGNGSGGDEKELPELFGYNSVGWASDGYLLLSKIGPNNGLLVSAVDDNGAAEPIKVASPLTLGY